MQLRVYFPLGMQYVVHTSEGIRWKSKWRKNHASAATRHILMHQMMKLWFRIWPFSYAPFQLNSYLQHTEAPGIDEFMNKYRWNSNHLIIFWNSAGLMQCIHNIRNVFIFSKILSMIPFQSLYDSDVRCEHHLMSYIVYASLKIWLIKSYVKSQHSHYFYFQCMSINKTFAFVLCKLP